MSRYDTPKISQPAAAGRYLWLLLGALALLGAVAWNGFGAGRGQLDDELQAARSELQQSRQQLDELQRERTRLEEQVAVLERSAQIDREAVKQVQQKLAAFEAERAESEKELLFLRSMVSTKEERRGVQIQRFKLEKTAVERQYRYDFTLTQSVTAKGPAVGSVFFALDGKQAGEPRWLPLREITEDNTELLRMRFKNFQDLKGVIQLPEGYTPLKVIIEVKPSNKKLPSVKRRYDWAPSG